MKWILFIALVIGWPLHTWFTEYDSSEAWSDAFLGFLIFVFWLCQLVVIQAENHLECKF